MNRTKSNSVRTS